MMLGFTRDVAVVLTLFESDRADLHRSLGEALALLEKGIESAGQCENIERLDELLKARSDLCGLADAVKERK